MGQDEIQKVKIVGPVITNTENPWRTQGDYREEQRQMLNAYRWAVGSSIAAIVAALCSIVLAYSAIAEIRVIVKEIKPPTTQQEASHSNAKIQHNL